MDRTSHVGVKTRGEPCCGTASTTTTFVRTRTANTVSNARRMSSLEAGDSPRPASERSTIPPHRQAAGPDSMATPTAARVESSAHRAPLRENPHRTSDRRSIHRSSAPTSRGDEGSRPATAGRSRLRSARRLPLASAARRRPPAGLMAQAATGSGRITCSIESTATNSSPRPTKVRRVDTGATRERRRETQRDVKRGRPHARFGPERLQQPEGTAYVCPRIGDPDVTQYFPDRPRDGECERGDTAIATPNGSERHTLAVIRISRNLAGRIAPSCCHDADRNPASPSSFAATQLLKSSANGAPRQTSGMAIATNAHTAVPKTARPARSAAATGCAVTDRSARPATRLLPMP